MKSSPPVRFDPDGLPFRPSFSLVSPATQDLIQALDDAAGGRGFLEEAVQRAHDALEGGADPCPPRDIFKAQALLLAVWAADTAENHRLMAPLIDLLAETSDQQSLDSALGALAVRGKPNIFKIAIARKLQSYGASLSNESGVINNLFVEITGKSDTYGALLVSHVFKLGWKPSGSADERRVMKAIIEGGMQKTMDVWVSIYEAHEHILPNTSDAMSPIVYASRQQHVKRNKTEPFNIMIKRMLLSGLAPWSDDPLQDWKRYANPWVQEAAVEGDARRIERQTQISATAHTRKRLRL